VSSREHLVAHPRRRGWRRQAAKDLRRRHDTGRCGVGLSRPAAVPAAAGQFGSQRTLQARLRLRDEEVRLHRAQSRHQGDVRRGHGVPGRQVKSLALGRRHAQHGAPGDKLAVGDRLTGISQGHVGLGRRGRIVALAFRAGERAQPRRQFLRAPQRGDIRPRRDHGIADSGRCGVTAQQQQPAVLEELLAISVE